MQKLSLAMLAALVAVAVIAVGTGTESKNAGSAQQAPPPADPLPKIPQGFTPIFNGRDLSGWHVSKTNHHGTTPDYRVLHGLIVGTQSPRGKGGILWRAIAVKELPAK
jgi:hypothetical protein